MEIVDSTQQSNWLKGWEALVVDATGETAYIG